MKSRAGCLIALIAAVVIAAAGAWFLFGPTAAPAVAPLSRNASAGALLRLVPQNADEIAVVPSSGPLLRTASGHPVTAEAVDRWRADQSIPFHPVLLGDSTLVTWRNGSERGAIAAPDAVRRLILRAVLTMRRGVAARLVGDLLVLGPPAPADGGPSWMKAGLALGSSLPGQAFFLQGPDSRFGYPPVGRPVFTAIAFDGENLLLTSRAERSGPAVPDDTVRPAFPQSALISVAAAHPPDALRTLARSFPIDVVPLLDDGATLSIYKVDERKLIPRLHAALVLPASSEPALLRALDAGPIPGILGGLGDLGEQRRTVAGVEVVRRRGLGYNIEYAKRGADLVVGFDKSTVEQYLTDALAPSPLGNQPSAWTVRVRPALLTPVLEKLSEAQQVRFLAPDLHRAIRDLGRWTDQLGSATAITAAKWSDGEAEVVRTVIEGPK